MACTIVDWQAVMREYELVRLNGYAMDREEATEGGICIGVPIRLAGSTVKSAISVSVPSSRMTAEREKEILEGLLSTANEVVGVLSRKSLTSKANLANGTSRHAWHIPRLAGRS